jgi:prepilin-type N-terminal cleavage/methylation domain-containing protein
MEFNHLGTTKGFTLIELAVVLVIVGIIIGMAFKGLELIDTANTRSEMQKMLKIRNALAAWISVNTKTEAAGDFPGDVVDGMYVYRFADLEGLTEDDRKNPFDNWSIVRGEAVSVGINLANTAGDSFFLYSDNLSMRFVCSAEVLMDDNDTTTGTIRSNITNTEKYHPNGCYRLDNDPVASKFLYYRLF